MDSFRKQIIFQVVIGLIILAALFAGLIFFGSNIRNYSVRINSARGELLERSASLSSLASVRNQYKTKAENYLNILNNIIPSRDQLINFAREVQAVTDDVSGFGFTFVSENPPTANSFGIINFVINLQATIPQFRKFLENIENFKYIVTIENFGLSRQSGETFQIPIRGQVFFK